MSAPRLWQMHLQLLWARCKRRVQGEALDTVFWENRFGLRS